MTMIAKTTRNALLAAAALTVASPAQAQEYFSSYWGGTGGHTVINFRCPSNGFLTGLSGRAGSWVDGIQAQCQYPGSTPYYGGNGGVSFSRSCPAGSLVTGILINAGLYVDGAYLICSPIEAIEVGQTDETSLSLFGGSGGNPTVYWTCGPFRAVTGFFGRHGTYLDGVGLVCNEL